MELLATSRGVGTLASPWWSCHHIIKALAGDLKERGDACVALVELPSSPQFVIEPFFSCRLTSTHNWEASGRIEERESRKVEMRASDVKFLCG